MANQRERKTIVYLYDAAEDRLFLEKFLHHPFLQNYTISAASSEHNWFNINFDEVCMIYVCATNQLTARVHQCGTLKKTLQHHIPIAFLLKNQLQDLPVGFFDYADDHLLMPGLTAERFVNNLLCNLGRTKRFQQERQLAERYAILANASNQIVWDWNIEKRTSTWTGKGLKSSLEYDVIEMVVDTDFWEENIHDDDFDRVMKRLKEALLDNKTPNWEEEYRFKNKQGNYRYILDRGYIIYKDGKPYRMIGAMEDITERKLAELAITESEKKYKELFSSMPMSLFVWEPYSGRILDVNQTASKEFNISRPQFIGRKMTDFMLAGNDKPVFGYMQDLISGKKEHQEFLTRCVTECGSILWVETFSQLTSYKGKTAILTVAKNTTEKMELEKEMEREKLLRHKQITEAVVSAQEKERSYIGRELHDNVNQLLSASRLYIEASLHETDGKELLSEASGYIMRAIEEIRMLSKALNTPLLNEMGLCESLKNLSLSISIVKDMDISLMDSGFTEDGLSENFKLTIFRIVQEQLTNILKHAEATEAKIFLERHTGFVLLKVQDNGKGFDVDAKRDGVGLTNIESRAAQYHGTVLISSARGLGSTIHVRFPIEAIYSQPIGKVDVA